MAVRFRSIFDVTREEWLAGLKLSEDEIPDVAILEGSWWREERQKARLEHLSEVRELGFPDIFWGKHDDKRIVFCMAYGAPRAVEISQIFALLGCKLVIQIGTCGGLQSHLAPGDIILPETIRCEDGVAAHYVTDGTISADPHWITRAEAALKAQGRTVYIGPHVTFSSLFAESVEMYEAWHKDRLLSVEMETATTLAAAAKYGVPGVSMVVVWDELTAGRRFMDPMPPAALAELEISNEAIFEAALTLTKEVT
jgi:uridine phosphorylase